MTLKYKIILSVVALLIAFGFGRFSATSPPSIKTAEVLKTDTQVKDNKDIKTHTVTITEKEPDGVQRTTTTTDTSTVDKETEIQDVQEQKTTEVQNKVRPRNNISLIAAQSLDIFIPRYGIMASREVLGPVTIGAFGMATASGSGAVLGISVGIDF